MNTSELRERVRSFFQDQARDYGLRADAVHATYVLNWGGFGSASFTVTDGLRTYHVKLSGEEEQLAALRRWRDLSGLLTERYHAPEVLDWITLPDCAYQGLLFPHLRGRTADLAQGAALLAQIIPVMTRLHEDRELAARLATAEVRTCGEYFRSTVGECDREDLQLIALNRPPFVSEKTLAWMRAEVARIDEWTRSSPAFAYPADRPVHGDAWQNNILVGDDGRWYLLDWDNVALGDPMLDYAILIWAGVHAGDGSLAPALAALAPDAAARERLELYVRACLLDTVVDVLADWIDVEAVPEHRDHVRAVHQATHERSLALYRCRYLDS